MINDSVKNNVEKAQDTKRKRIGIIGGLGPAASARLYERITKFTDATCDQEHLEVILISIPQIPDRTDYLLGKPGAPSFVPPMNKIALTLEKLGCEIIATSCNTSHALLHEVGAGLQSAHLISMIEVTAEALCSQGCTRVGVLATEGTRASKVYDRTFEAAGLQAMWPDRDGQNAVTQVIYDQVKAGKPADLRMMNHVCATMREAGCDAIVLACTELSVIGLPEQVQGMCVFDALDELACACVQAAGAQVKRSLRIHEDA